MPIPILYITSTLLFLGIASMPYGYYAFLRILVTGVFLWASYIAVQRKNDALIWLFLIIALIFNPFFKIHFSKNLWSLVNIISGIILLLSKNFLSQEEILPETQPKHHETTIVQPTKPILISPETKTIHGEEHKKLLIESISEAKENLVILSGWITEYVVDNFFMRELEKTLIKGVKIYIGYGWQDYQGNHQYSESSLSAIDNLKNMTRKFPQNLFIGEFANHEKILIQDDNYIVCGSNNWLSNSKFKNSETSRIEYNKEGAIQERKRIKKLIMDNLLKKGKTPDKPSILNLKVGEKYSVKSLSAIFTYKHNYSAGIKTTINGDIVLFSNSKSKYKLVERDGIIFYQGQNTGSGNQKLIYGNDDLYQCYENKNTQNKIFLFRDLHYKGQFTIKDKPYMENGIWIFPLHT